MTEPGVVECPAGHWYDADSFERCPYCVRKGGGEAADALRRGVVWQR